MDSVSVPLEHLRNIQRLFLNLPLDITQPPSRKNPVIGNLFLRHLRRLIKQTHGREFPQVLRDHVNTQFGPIKPEEMDFLLNFRADFEKKEEPADPVPAPMSPVPVQHDFNFWVVPSPEMIDDIDQFLD